MNYKSNPYILAELAQLSEEQLGDEEAVIAAVIHGVEAMRSRLEALARIARGERGHFAMKGMLAAMQAETRRRILRQPA